MLRPLASLLLAAACASPLLADTRIRIEGTRRKSEAQVLELVGDRLEHIRAKPASTSRAEDAAFLVAEILRRDGYADVQVAARVTAQDEIRLTVREGERLALGTVQVSGVPSEEQKKLAALFAKPAEKDRPIASGNPPFREEDLDSGLAILRQEYQARGHWAATAELSRRQKNKDGSVSIDAKIIPGPLHRIAKPDVHSPDGRGVVRTATTAQPFIGRPASTANLNALRQAVEDAFLSRGYPDAKIRMSRKPAEGNVFLPAFEIDLGTRVRLVEIKTEGLERTHPSRVTRRTRSLQGEWYDEAAMRSRVRGMLASGAFSSIRVETEEIEPKRVAATLHFQEARAREINLAAGFGTYEGFITRFTYTDRNLSGRLLGLSAGFETSMRGLLGETRLTDPWFLGYDLAASLRIYALSFAREGYKSLESGAEASLLWKPTDAYALEGLFGYSFASLSEDGLTSAELGETDYFNPRLRITQTYDRRDNPVLPTRGWHLRMPLEIGAAVGDNSSSYFKTSLEGSWHHRLDAKHQLALGGRWGILIPSGDGGDLPIDLRLFNGGAGTVRSFPERELGPLSANGYALGGEASWSANCEIIRSLSGAIKAVAFLDAGSLARNYEALGGGSVELAAGLGLRFELPVGPVRLEYGHNLTRDPGEPNGTFHFAIGTTF
jgi:outer membrane protein insertion porin family